MGTFILTSALRGPLTMAALCSLVDAGQAAAQNMMEARTSSADYVQVILRGVLYDDSTRAALEGATIVVVDTAGEPMSKVARSDTAGHFEVNIAFAGKYRIVASREGFVTVLSSAIEFENSEVVDIEIPLSKAGTPRSKGAIVSREPIALSMWEPDDFVRRREAGVGRFAGPAELRHTRSRPIIEVLGQLGAGASASSSIRFVQTAASDLPSPATVSTCPTIWLVNGEVTDLKEGVLAVMSTAEFRAIELYRHGEAPAELGPAARKCGAVVLWVR
jgi:hypothetical protein